MKNVFSKVSQVPYAFVLMNWAVLAGLFHFVHGHQTFWNSTVIAPAPLWTAAVIAPVPLRSR
jgi:hypothetical protein